MLKKLIYGLLGIVLLITGTSFLPAPAEPGLRATAVPGPRKPAIKTIIIDAGHGGRDAGAHGDYSYEKNICLAVALKLGKRMEEEFPDLKILYTRTSDTYPAIRARADFANTNKGDLFISIHVNAMPQIRHIKRVGTKTEVYYTGKGKKRKRHTRRVPNYKVYYTIDPSKGTETYIWAADRSDEKGGFVGERVAEEVNDSIEYAPDINSPEFQAKSLLWTKRYFDKSLLLASLVEKEFAGDGRTSLGVKQRNEKGIWVLQATAMPSILVETGYITNRSEEDYLNSKRGQDEIANSIVKAVRRYREATEGAGKNAFNNTISSSANR
jgi:N-acetylmuramoyl-L-alanine amidase